ncbi:related to myosin-like protein [Phialocephala subalpina]|uniref:Related to myosin-like protein n=1 Tax=Phialocephala subalpina TaxID=576137 RepID=A0A1L7WGU0_9HELO|nr:related to myosin-like protein [Phialocephala subalpina]
MSHLLWKYYYNEDVDRFRHLLSNGSNSAAHTLKGYGGASGNSQGSLVGSPGGFGTPPRTVVKQRKVSGQPGNTSGIKGTSSTLGRAEINSRDHAGLTILHRAASSTSEHATSFALALLEHPSIDLYVQDAENGWTALHRALYFGNIALARAIIEKDNRDRTSQMGTAAQRPASSIIKVKDYEGNSPFDVYNATIARRSLQTGTNASGSDDGSDDAESVIDGSNSDGQPFQASIDGDEVFAWGSNRNHGLGFKDQDDRQHPEKITLKRPDHLLFRFYREYVESVSGGELATKLPPTPKLVSDLPTLISNRPIIIQDVAVSKLHSAILTTDPESNLYICGFGPGGRLGTGDESTRFSYTPIEEGGLSGKKVVKVALGQNHSLAVTSEGSLLSWGTNTYGQLGYTLPRPALQDEEPICATPRQIFGPLKRETIVGVAASAIHSAAHTSTSLFTWGKNEGQLGLMDSDSRSLEIQPVPRKVASSLFKAPINMVSAINTATVILLANHTVYVFTNYGYNIVKFPLYEGFTNYHLQNTALTTRYEATSNHISQITAGGDTIGALSSRGDLFTVTVRSIPTMAAASTTNPSKIKDSLSPPQRVWALRKGNWDGIKSVGITENGSVIVCTQAGAVWRRIKRAKIEDAFMGTGNLNRKDFKFQRVPGLTKVAAVRSTPFGVYAAICKDCDVTRTQIVVDEQSLWDDIAPLLSVRDLEASEAPEEEEDTDTPRYWSPTLRTDHFEPLKRAVLTSPDLEADVARHLLGETLDGYDFEIGSSTSEVSIPVHGFMLGRSPVLRSLLDEFRSSGIASIPDMLTISSESAKARSKVVFQGLDFITVVNLAAYLYTDSVIDVWHFTRHCPRMAFRYRQIRVELMKTAGHLKLTKLENAVRLMTEPERRMNVDLAGAWQDPSFFGDGNTIIELDGSEVVAHRALLCQRCPFFEGLFHGRAGGQWLAGRRESGDEAVRIDLKHVHPDTFRLVLNYLYADAGTELFDNVVSDDIDEFSELVMDVMAVANELMLDRLSQICQQVIGRFVTTRNVCHLLNAIAPCSVTGFKDTALEYLCLQLESMLENHLLNDLDEDILLELDEVVRSNQLNCLPFAKSGRAELLLHERHPSLAEDISEERQRRVRDMIFRSNLKDDEGKLSSSYRARVGSLDDLLSASPSQDRSRRRSKAARNAPFSPSLQPKNSTIDLMFDMDEDDQLAVGSPVSPGLKPVTADGSPASPKVAWDEPESRSVPDEDISSLPLRTPPSSIRQQAQTTSSPKTWSSPVLPSTKLDMREIMAQASSSRTSNLSMGLSAERAKDEAIGKQAKAKISQKERKKQQQQTMQQMLSQPQISLDKGDGKLASPWQLAGMGPKTSLKDVLSEPKSSPSNAAATRLESPVPSRSLTPRRTASPDTRFSGQQRRVSNSIIAKSQSSASSSRLMTQRLSANSTPIVPHSKSYTTPAAKAEPSLQLSMADIIGQQTREQEVIKEAVAKRSLQEIQEEQAFQEWWDQESRRAQEEEAVRNKVTASGSGRGGKGSGRGKSGGRGRGGRSRGDASQGRGRGRGQEKASSS